MALTNVTLLASTQGEVSVTGDPVRASGSIRSAGTMYTVAIYPLNFIGRVYIEGTLATNPADIDWFPIILPGQTTSYIEFTDPTSTQVGFNFNGSFTWVRARQDRDYLGLTGYSEAQLAPYGYLDKVLLNMGSWSADQTLPTTGPLFTTVNSVAGNNLGLGAKLYANAVGQTNILMNFKSVMQGNGITITEDPQTITITNTGAFTDLTDVPSSITTNGLLIGNSTTLQYVTPPSQNGEVLSHTANGVVWATPSYVSYLKATAPEATGSVLFGTINGTVLRVIINVTAAFLGTSTLTVGSSTAPTELVAATDIDLTTTGVHVLTKAASINDSIAVFVNGSGGGSASVIVEYLSN